MRRCLFCSEVLRHASVCSWGSQFVLQPLRSMCLCFSPPAVIFRWSVQRPQCVFHGKRRLCSHQSGRMRFTYWKVLTGCVYRAGEGFPGPIHLSYWRELFQLMFVVNSWVYLGDRRHTVIVRHQTGNAEQVWLSLWHKRGWFWPLPNWWCVCLNPWSQIAVLSLINSRPLDFDCAALVFW